MSDFIRVSVAYASPKRQAEVAANVPAGTTIDQSLTLLATEIAALTAGEATVAVGVWGKIRPPQYVLREGDRIELYRALEADPKQARRTRASKNQSSTKS